MGLLQLLQGLLASDERCLYVQSGCMLSLSTTWQ